MKYLKTFSQLNESLRDKMVGITREEMLDKFLEYDDIDDLLYQLFDLEDEELVQYVFDNIPGLYDNEMAVDDLVSYHLEYSDHDLLVKLFNEKTELHDNVQLASGLLYSSFRKNDIDTILKILERFPKLDGDIRDVVNICLPDIESPEHMEKLLKFERVKETLNEKQLYVIEKYYFGKHQDKLMDFEKEVIDILEKLEYVESGDILIGKLDDKAYLNYNQSTKKLYYHIDRLSLPFMKDKKNPVYSDFKYNLNTRYVDIVVGGLVSDYLNIEYDEIVGSRNDDLHFITESKKEEKIKKQRKEEKLYLSKSERERLNDLQKRAKVRKRKEKGSYNDDDFNTF